LDLEENSHVFVLVPLHDRPRGGILRVLHDKPIVGARVLQVNVFRRLEGGSHLIFSLFRGEGPQVHDEGSDHCGGGG
jgi:hypothetical protein